MSETSSRSRSASSLTLEEPRTVTPSILPTAAAEASRALVGDTTISEHYSFAGVHHVFEQHAGSPVSRLLFAHDERSRLAIAGADGTLTLCAVNDDPANASHLVLSLKGHTGAVTDFAWSTSNDLIASVSLDSTLRVWDANSGECVRVMPESAPLLSCVFQPLNNNHVVVGSSKGHLTVFNISTGKHIKSGSCKVSGAATALACDSGGGLLWAGDDQGYVTSFRIHLTSGKLAKGRRICVCHGRKISSLASRSWMSREARDPYVLMSVSANILCLYRVVDSDGSLQFRAKFPIKHARASSG